jgi:hypothetical protein
LWHLFGVVIDSVLIRPLVKLLPAQVLFSNVREDLKPFRILNHTPRGSCTAPAAKLLLGVDDIEVALGNNLGTGSIDARQDRATNAIILSILESESFISIAIVIPVLTNGVNPTGRSVIFNKLLGPDIGPDGWIQGKSDADEQQSDYVESHMDFIL